MKKKNDICEVLDFKKVKKHCPQVVKHCKECGQVIIDHDNIPEEYIVDYNDIHIKSAMYTCCKCGKEICEECSVTIEGDWEKLYICTECYAKKPKQVERIKWIQRKIEALNEEFSDEIEEFLND